MVNVLLNNYQFINYINVPVSGQFGFQSPGTFYMLSVMEMHALLMFYCIIVFCCVCGMLFEVWYRFSIGKVEYPTSNISDNWIIEWMFISVPYCIVFLIILPSWALLYASNETHDCDCTMKAIGYQWNWLYEVHNYPFWVNKGYDWRAFWCAVREGANWRTTTIAMLELNNVDSLLTNYSYGFLWYTVHNNIANYVLIACLQNQDILNGNSGYLAYLQYKWESITLPAEELYEGHYSLFEVSNAVFLPIHSWVSINITSADVIHSWAIPSFATNIDGVPGSLNTGYLFILYEGLFYGQCSEFCGSAHYNMSIVVNGTSESGFN